MAVTVVMYLSSCESGFVLNSSFSNLTLRMGTSRPAVRGLRCPSPVCGYRGSAVLGRCYRIRQALRVVSIFKVWTTRHDELSIVVNGRLAQGVKVFLPDTRLHKVIIDRLRRRSIRLNGMQEYQEAPERSGVSHKIRALWSDSLTKRDTRSP